MSGQILSVWIKQPDQILPSTTSALNSVLLPPQALILPVWSLQAKGKENTHLDCKQYCLVSSSSSSPPTEMALLFILSKIGRWGTGSSPRGQQTLPERSRALPWGHPGMNRKQVVPSARSGCCLPQHPASPSSWLRNSKKGSYF